MLHTAAPHDHLGPQLSQFCFPNLVLRPHRAPAHQPYQGRILDPWKGRAHLWRADADMTIQQVMAHLDILNRVLEQTLKEEKIQMT